MNLILYEPVMGKNGNELYKTIENIDQQESGLEIHRTIDSLSRRLRQPIEGQTVAVLFAASKEDLSNIVSIKDLLLTIRIILILPDREENTIAAGHCLRPRFLTYADSDFGEVADVLNKMIRSCND